MYPISCLENEVRLAERMHLSRTSSNIDLLDDGIWQSFFKRSENQLWLAGFTNDLKAKAEQLLKIECCLLSERTKVSIVADHLNQEIALIE